jgi:hypothetical protein
VRSLIAGAMAACAVWVLSSGSVEQNSLEKSLRVFPDRSVLRSLPPRSVIGASLIRGEKWYVLSTPEIVAARKLIDGTPASPPKGMNFVLLPPLMDRLVFWGIADGQLVWLDVLAVDDSVRFLVPVDTGCSGWYSVPDGKERECLRRLIKRIVEGKEQPLVPREEQRTKSQGEAGAGVAKGK